MTNLELMRAIGQVEDDLLAEAETPIKRPLIPLPRWLLAAILGGILLMLIGCTAVFVLNNRPMLEAILGANGRRTYASDTVGRVFEPGGERTELDEALAKKYIEPNVFPVDKTITDGVSTLTVLSGIVDRTSCAASLYMKLDNPSAYEVYNSGRILFKVKELTNIWYIHPTPLGQENIIGRLNIDEASTTEETLYFVFLFSCTENCTALELRLNGTEDILVIPLPETSNLPSIHLEDDGIRLSPFGMQISSALLQQDDSPRYPNEFPRELAIHFRDGSEYLIQRSRSRKLDEDFAGYAYGMALDFTPDGFVSNYVFIFNRVVEIRDIAAVRINEHVYSVMQ